eukprot:5725763-Prymnesium_polylepis.1
MLSTLAAGGRARAWHASSPQTMAGHRGVPRDTAAKEAAVAGMLSSQLGSMRSDGLWPMMRPGAVSGATRAL